jgi:hypothetical protein
MDIRDLTYFELIASAGHFGRAADVLDAQDVGKLAGMTDDDETSG